MKLHLPLPLRSALVAAFACLSAAASEEIVWTVDAPEGYRAVFRDCTQQSYQCEYDSLMNTGTTGVKDSVTGVTKYIDNGAIYGCFYQQVERATHKHVLSTGTGYGHSTTYQNVVLTNEDGKGENITWNCSAEDSPGVWILASSDSTGTAAFTNYGDMVVDGSRQQWIKKQAAALSNGVVTDWTYTTTNFSDHALFSGVSEIGFNLKVTDTDSFTYKNAYTSNRGAFVSGFKSIVFDNVNDITFSGNRADVSGAIAFASDRFWTQVYSEITDDTGFVVRNVSGTVTFDNNLSGGNVTTGNGLFRNYLVRFNNVTEVIFSNNQCRLFSNYNYPIYTGFENCDRIVFSGNGAEGLNSIISSGVGSGIFETGSMRFDNCGDIVFSDNIQGSCLFGSFPVFHDIKSLEFCENVSSGTLLTRRSDASITIGAVTDSFAIDDNVITGSDQVGAIAAASMTVNGISKTDASGEEITKANLVSISGNKVSGSVYEGFFRAAAFNASNFRKAVFDNNVYTEGNSKSYSYAIFSNLALTNLDDVFVIMLSAHVRVVPAPWERLLLRTLIL